MALLQHLTNCERSISWQPFQYPSMVLADSTRFQAPNIAPRTDSNSARSVLSTGGLLCLDFLGRPEFHGSTSRRAGALEFEQSLPTVGDGLFNDGQLFSAEGCELLLSQRDGFWFELSVALPKIPSNRIQSISPLWG